MRLKLVLTTLFALWIGSAHAADPNINLTAASQCTGAVLGVQCPASPVGPLNPLWVQFQLSGGATPSTAQKQDTGNNILNAIFGLTPQLNVDGGALSHITNFPATQPPGTTSSFVSGQIAIAVTGTAVQLPSHAGLVNGVLVKACGGWTSSGSPAQHVNTAAIVLGSSAVTNVCDGTGTGECIAPGASDSFPISNTNLLYVNGVAGDCLTFQGN